MFSFLQDSCVDLCDDYLRHFIVIPILGEVMRTEFHPHHLLLAVPLVKYLNTHSHILNSVMMLDVLPLDYILFTLVTKDMTLETSYCLLLIWLMNHLIEYTLPLSPCNLSQCKMMICVCKYK